MDKQKLNYWKDLADKILDSSRDFMTSSNNKTFARGIIGELLTFSQLISTYKNELTSCEENKIKYSGSSKKGLDFELSLNGCNIEINSKGTTQYDKKKNRPRWVRQHANQFRNTGEGNKNITPKTTKNNPIFFYVYVDTVKWLENSEPEFFTLSKEEANNKFTEIYNKSRIGKEPRDSDDFWVEYDNIEEYKDNELKRIYRM